MKCVLLMYNSSRYNNARLCKIESNTTFPTLFGVGVLLSFVKYIRSYEQLIQTTLNYTWNHLIIIFLAEIFKENRTIEGKYMNLKCLSHELKWNTFINVSQYDLRIQRAAV